MLQLLPRPETTPTFVCSLSLLLFAYALENVSHMSDIGPEIYRRETLFRLTKVTESDFESIDGLFVKNAYLLEQPTL